MIDGEYLYYPDDRDFTIYNAKLTEQLSAAGEFTFDLPESNLMYSKINCRQSMIQILKDGKEVFYGEVREITEDTDKIKSVYCVGELAFLFDSVQPQRRFQNITPKQMFIELINEHNNQVEEKKRFTVGIVTVIDENNSIYHYTNYEDTLTAIREKLCDTLGGYLRIRKVDGVRYIDLVRLQDYGVSCEQTVQFGINLLDYAKNSDTSSLATAIVPLGARLENQVIEGLDAYATIESVNDGKNYVFSQAAVEQFGWIRVVVNWDDVTLPENLKRKAEEYLTSVQFEQLTLELTAVDLSMLDLNINTYNVGDMVHAVAEPYGMDSWFPLQEKVTYLQEPAKNSVILSNNMQKSYTQQAAEVNKTIENSIPQESEMLIRAKANATQLITSATNGNIYLVYDDDGNPKELLIMDTKDIDTAQKVWRWNINGLGYSAAGYNGPYGMAMTMDGSIVADFIRAGTLTGVEINNGSGTFAVDKNGNVIANSLKSNNAEITGGRFSISADDDTSIFTLKGKTYNTLVTPETITIFNTVEKIFVRLSLQGIYAGTYSGTPGEGIVAYSSSVYFDTLNGCVLCDTEAMSAFGNLRVSNNAEVKGTLYTASGTVSKSDRSVKNSIEELDLDTTSEFVYKLIPSKFKYNNGTSGRYHHGLIAQEVKSAMGDNDWGIYCDGNAEEEGNKGLRYEELIADLIATVQSQNKRILKLENRTI